MKSRLPAIDIFKLIASILVITIHTDPLTKISDSANFVLVHIIARVAVPFFIVCTGFFIGAQMHLYGLKTNNLKDAKIVILKSCFKFFKLYLLCSVIYLILIIPNWISTNWFSYKAFIDWGVSFLFTGSYYHLWYLMEMCYALLILSLIISYHKKVSIPLFLFLILSLWTIGVLKYAYAMIFPSGVQQILSLCDKVRMPIESITRVLPLLMLGILLQYINYRKLMFYSVGLLLSIILLFFEVYFVKSLGGEKFSYLFFTLPVSFFLFCVIHFLDNVFHIENTFAFAKISTFVYCAHPAIILLLSYFNLVVSNMFQFLFASIISLSLGHLYYILNRFKKAKRYN